MGSSGTKSYLWEIDRFWIGHFAFSYYLVFQKLVKSYYNIPSTKRRGSKIIQSMRKKTLVAFIAFGTPMHQNPFINSRKMFDVFL